MPNRMIRDDLLTSERYWSVSPEARNMYVAIVLSADDCARYTATNFALRTKCMAGTVSAERIEKLLTELMDADLVRVYEDGGARFVFVPRFRQRLRYTNSKYPAPPTGINDLVIEKTDSGKPQDIPKPAEVKRSEVKRSEEIQKQPRAGKARAVSLPENFGKPFTPALQEWLDSREEKNIEAHLVHFIGYAKANGKAYVDWDQAFQNAVRGDWAGVRKSGGGQSSAAWWSSETLIEAKAKELGVALRPGETWNQLKGRIQERIGT